MPRSGEGAGAPIFPPARSARGEARKRRGVYPPEAARPLYLILGHYSVTADIMTNKTDRLKQRGEISYYTKVYTYPCGIVDVVAASRPIFREPGWEDAADWKVPTPKVEGTKKEAKVGDPEDMARSMRRARAKVRRLALSNNFRWFVTLTLDQRKVDRYDPSEVVRKLNQWCSNQVKRRGLQYILVPERHKDGALHFHGFFSDALEAVASGHRDGAGHMIFNLPGWTLGFTAAIEVYGDYAGAVAYVCKYIGKQGEKPAGRWYYSGGALKEPAAVFGEISPNELVEQFGDRVFEFDTPAGRIAVCNGIRPGDQSAQDWEQIGIDMEDYAGD